MSEPFIGEIIMFAGNFAPRGWAFCNGQLLSIAQNTALFSILGTTYGGDGRVTFALPDLRGRVPVHPGQGPGLSNYVLGEATGVESTTLLTSQMPAHNHLITCNSDSANTDQNSPANAYIGAQAPAQGGGIPLFASSANATMNVAEISPAGGSQPFSVLQPLLCVNFIIALEGIFPSRN